MPCYASGINGLSMKGKRREGKFWKMVLGGVERRFWNGPFERNQERMGDPSV